MEDQIAERELLERCRRGDAAAFETLVSAYEQKVLNLAYRMMGNRQDAEDMTQDIFLKVYRSVGNFKENSSFSTWLYRVATNVCLDALRKRKKSQNDVSIQQRGDDDSDYELSIPNDAPSPFEMAQRKEAMAALETALKSLSPDQRMAVTLRDIDGLSYEEIARITRSSLGTTKSRINRARLALRKILEDQKELFM